MKKPLDRLEKPTDHHQGGRGPHLPGSAPWPVGQLKRAARGPFVFLAPAREHAEVADRHRSGLLDLAWGSQSESYLLKIYQ